MTNVVVDALRHTTMGNVSHFEEEKKELLKDVHRLSQLGVFRRFSKWWFHGSS